MSGTEPHKLRRNDHPDTSHAAALTVDTAQFEELAYDIILATGLDGCIQDQLAEGFAVRAPPRTQYVNRRTGLHQKGRVLDSGRRRTGRSGRQQAVYVATELLKPEWIEWIKLTYPDLNRCLHPEAPSDWTAETAIEQVESCDFECEAGPLANNVAWRWIKEQLNG